MTSELPEYVIFMPALCAHYTEIVRLGRTLQPCPANLDQAVAKIRPPGASHLAWVTQDQIMARRMRRLGALVVQRTESGLSAHPDEGGERSQGQ